MMEQKIARIVFWTTVSWCCAISVWAQGDGGQAGNFLRYGVGGRALGMGRAFVAVADDASGVYWNPAGILGTKRLELASMYSDLYFDSQFTHFGIVVPRPGEGIKDKVGQYLVGHASALGFGWIGLSSTGYEQRTHTGEYLGDFGIGENAFFLAWAREEVGSWGIFRYGVSLKFVNQDFSGLQSSPSTETVWENRDWSGGMDLGFTFQPLNAPLFRSLPLRYMLPLRFGFVLQNIMQPSFRIGKRGRDPFPRVLRCGLSYRMIMRDWIPGSWESFRRFVGQSQILFAFDSEFYKGADEGFYFGLEGLFPLSGIGFVASPRFGLNNRTEGISLGFGLSMPVTQSTMVRIDYAYGFHPDLPEDSRFFLTFQMGREMGAAYFKEASERQELEDRKVRNYLIRVLSEYPNEYIFDAVHDLAALEDSIRARRYYDLSGGIGRAGWLFLEAKSLRKEGKVEDARNKAEEAVREYTPIFVRPGQSMSDDELMDFGESLIIANRIEDAVTVLGRIENSTLRTYFLLGTCWKALNDWDSAIEVFRSAVRRYEEEQDLNSMVYLSFMDLGEALVRKEQYESALTTLQVVLKNHAHRLDSNYPRYPIYWDDYIVDDAQFLAGVCILLMKRYEDGVAELLKTQRLFPNLEYGRFVEEKADELIEALDSSNWSRIDTLTNQYLEYYYQKHAL